MTASTDPLIDQLAHLVDNRLLDPLEILLDGDASVAALRDLIKARARTWAARLRGSDDRAAAFTAIRIVSILYPGDTPFEPPVQWWSTPFGQVVARRVGHPTAESLSYPVAGAILGISRQGVYDLASRGKLVRHPDGGVTPASVRDRLLHLDELRHDDR